MAADLDALVERAQGLGLTGRTTIMRALNLTGWKAAQVVDALKARRAAAASEDEPSGFPGRLAELLTGSPRTVEDLANALDCSPARVRAGLNDLNAAGHPIQERGPDAFVRETNPAPAHTPTELPPPDDRGVIRIGFVSDTHLGSMQQQLTHLRDAYRRMSDLGITTVYHVGDVLAGVNVYRGQHNELFLHSYDEQIAYAVEAYPRTPGIVTKAIAGNHDLRSLKDGGADPVKVWAMQRPDAEYLGPYSAWATAGDFSIYLLHPDGGGSYAVSYKLQKLIECVPLNSEILTRDGWKLHSEVSVGDEVLGYNHETDRCEWTTIRAKSYGREDAVRYHNEAFDVTCTLNHRWAIDWERGVGRGSRSSHPHSRHLWSIQEARERARIIQAAPAPDGPGFPQLNHREWLRRDVAVQSVMLMTSGERRAFIEAMMLGEGTLAVSEYARVPIFSQRPGPVNDAFRLACFLEGIATNQHFKPAGSYKPNGSPTVSVTMLAKRMRNVGSLRVEPAGEVDVWCPTTDLGTWVMRQGSLITITGNSFEGGRKPSIAMVGHWHQAVRLRTRGVKAYMPGCFEAQTEFERRRMLQPQLGALALELRMNDAGSVHQITEHWIEDFVPLERDWK